MARTKDTHENQCVAASEGKILLTIFARPIVLLGSRRRHLLLVSRLDIRSRYKARLPATIRHLDPPRAIVRLYHANQGPLCQIINKVRTENRQTLARTSHSQLELRGGREVEDDASGGV